MTRFEQQIRRARDRLTQNVLLAQLGLGVLVAAGLWAVVILVVRTVAWDVPLWHGAWLAAVVASLIALVGTMIARPSLLHAAITLDGAAGLKERLSTALVVGQSADPFARAAVQDAEKTAARVHVPMHIRWNGGTLWPWSGAVTFTALLLCWLMPPIGLFAKDAEQETLVPREVVEAEHNVIKAELDQRLNKIKQLAQDNESLKDIAEDIEPFELPDTPGLKPEDIRREAVKRIDAVGDKLKEQLAAAENDPLDEMKRMLRQLEPQSGDNAGTQLSKSLATGDFQGAKDALQQMQEQLQEAAQNADDPEMQQRLAQMQNQLAKLADQLTKLSESVQIQKDLENKAGLTEEEAKQLAEKLKNMDPQQLQKELQRMLGDKLDPQQLQELTQKIQQNQQAQQMCKNLAQQMAQAAQACQQCQGAASSDAAGQGANALSSAMSMMSSMEMAEMMSAELQAQLSDLERLRYDVCEGNCQGRGRMGQGEMRVGEQGPNYGLGLGSRIGKEKTPYDRDPTKAKTRFQGGTVIGQMLVDGPQVPGEATADVLTAAEAEVRDAQDAIEREEVPRQYDKVLREYFDRLAGLVREKKAAESAGESP